MAGEAPFLNAAAHAREPPFPKSMAVLAPEFRLLCLAVRRTRRVEDGPALRATLGAAPDWALVVEGAKRHRVSALVLARLQAPLLADDTPALPSGAISELRRHVRDSSAQCLAQAAEVIRLVRLFAAAGIRVMVLKGVVLSQQLYGSLAMRGSGDIDLLVDPAQFWEADAVLTAAGYRSTATHLSPARHADGQRMFKDLIYHDVSEHGSPGGNIVELHQRLTENPHRMPTDFDALWRDRGEVMLGGTAVATLPPEILPLYLCVHGANHCWDRLCWLADLAVLLKDAEGVAKALADADATGLGAAMRLSVTLAHDWLGLALPSGARTEREVRRVERLIRRFFTGSRWLHTPEQGTWESFRRRIWWRINLYSLREGWRHVCNEVWSDLIRPSDWDLVPLPPRLVRLYPLLRPFGWLVRNARKRAERRTARR